MSFRFSVKTLLAAFTLVAVSCGGLIYASSVWAGFFYTAALLTVLVGIVAAVLRRGPARAFWIGFAVFATGYFVMAERDEQYLVLPGQYNVNREPSLITTQLLVQAREFAAALAAPSIPPNPRGIYAPQGPGIVQVGNRTVIMRGEPGNFVRIGHSLFTLVFGLIGGTLGNFIARRHLPATESGGNHG